MKQQLFDINDMEGKRIVSAHKSESGSLIIVFENNFCEITNGIGLEGQDVNISIQQVSTFAGIDNVFILENMGIISKDECIGVCKTGRNIYDSKTIVYLVQQKAKWDEKYNNL